MRSILRALLVIVLLGVAAFILFGYWTGRPVGSAGVGPAGTERARERGAELGEKVAVAAEKVKETVDEAALTTKIKAKMALDDSVRARSVDVSTRGSTVTVAGTVRSVAEHDRAVALARETVGVSRVVDHLVVQP
jgi:hyperosmotically inducible periplasmic protein